MSKRRATEGAARKKKDGIESSMMLDPENGSKQVKKLDKQSGVEEEKVKNAPLVATRTSARVLNRQKREASPPGSPPPCSKKQATEASTSTPETKTRRAWELWASEDKNTFFEGLYQFGKDFEAIQNLIAQKCRKRGVASHMIKNRDQVRHLYYRTWHKISKHIKQRPDVDKTTNELFGLINYGEFRKRIAGAIDEKNGPKLNELVRTGTATVKVRGKQHSLRTPRCPALKKFARYEYPEYELAKPTVPDHIAVEVQPKNNSAWAHVQAMAQNPCVRMKLRPEQRLSAIIQFLNKKWKPRRLRLKESLKAAAEAQTKELQLCLPSGVELVPVRVQCTHDAACKPKMDLALDNICRKFIGGQGDGPSVTDKKASLEEDGHTQSEESSHSSDEIHDHSGEKLHEAAIDIDDNQNHFIKRSNSVPNEAGFAIFGSGILKAADGESRTRTCSEGNAADCKLKVEDDGKVRDEDEKEEEGIETMNLIATLKQGWTGKDANKVTLAEIWLAAGNPEKIVLHYDWVTVADSVPHMQMSLANMLRRLIQLASTEFTDFNRQSCVMTSPSRCAKCGGDPSTDSNGTPPNSKKSNSRTASAKSPKGALTTKSQGTQTVNINCGRGRIPAGKLSAKFADQNIEPQLVNGEQNASNLQDGVFRMPTIPVKTQTIRPLGREITQNGVAIPAPSIVLPKKPKRAVQRRRLITQRTILPKAPPAFIGVPILPGQQHPVCTGSIVMPSEGSGINQVSIVDGRLQAKPAPTRSLSPASAPGVVTVRTLSRRMSPTALDVKGASVIRTVEGELSKEYIQVAEITPGVRVEKVLSSSHTPMSSSNMQQSLDEPGSPDNILKAAAAEAGITLPTPDAGIPTTVTGLPKALLEAADSTTMAASESAITSSAFTPLSSSPPTFPSLLDMPLPGVEESSAEKLLDITLANSSSSFSELFGASGSKPLDAESDKDSAGTALPLPPDITWDDLSLTSMGNLLESPCKKPAEGSSNTAIPPLVFGENTNETLVQVDNTLQCMMNESSMDYVNTFAELAEQISANDTSKDTS